MKPILFGILAGLCWGIGEVCTKQVLHSGRVGPMTVLLVRTAIALPFALLVFLLATRVWNSEPRDWWQADAGILVRLLLGSSLLAGFGGVMFFYLGLHAAGGDVSKVKPIAFSLAPAIAVVLGWWVLGEPMSARKAIGVGLILAGVVLVAGARGGAGQPPAVTAMPGTPAPAPDR